MKLKHWQEKRSTGKQGQTWVSYYHVVKVDGKVRWTSLGRDRGAALRKWAEIESKPAPAAAGTFNSVADEYMTWAEAEVKAKQLAKGLSGDTVRRILIE